MKRIPVDFSYGDETVTVEIPESSFIGTLEPGDDKAAADPGREVMNALLHPIGTKRLRELAAGKKSVLIMVPDKTRKLPLDILLPQVISELEDAGVNNEAIEILIGAGTHRAMTDDEIRAHFGKELYDRYKSRIHNHEWWIPEQLKYIGMTPNGTPIDINRYVCEADFKIAIGSVKPHRDAGWSGGAKMIQPGVSGFRTTGRTHWLAAQYPVQEILGNNDNVVRREMEQIASQVGLDFIVNCVLDDHYNISEVYAGHFIDAHRAACMSARKHFTARIHELCDILICGSSKEQSSMWSNATGPNWSELVVKEGGTVILLAKCIDGICDEHPDVLKYGYLPTDKIKALVDAGEISDLAAASHIQHGGEKLCRKNIRCIIVSEGVSREDAARLGIEYAESPQEALETALSYYGETARVYAYPSYYFSELIVEYGNIQGHVK
jgi:nickel-dependent lactate racemase